MAGSLRGGATDDHYRQVADLLIREMKRSDSPWKKAWQPGGGRMPYNLQTGQPYRGGNSILLLTTADQRGYSDERWGTYKQVRNVGGYVRRGQKGCGIVYWQFEKRKLARDQHNQPVMDERGPARVQDRAAGAAAGVPGDGVQRRAVRRASGAARIQARRPGGLRTKRPSGPSRSRALFSSTPRTTSATTTSVATGSWCRARGTSRRHPATTSPCCMSWGIGRAIRAG